LKNGIIKINLSKGAPPEKAGLELRKGHTMKNDIKQAFKDSSNYKEFLTEITTLSKEAGLDKIYTFVCDEIERLERETWNEDNKYYIVLQSVKLPLEGRLNAGNRFFDFVKSR